MRARAGGSGVIGGWRSAWRPQLAIALAVVAVVVVCLGATGALGSASAQPDPSAGAQPPATGAPASSSPTPPLLAPAIVARSQPSLTPTAQPSPQSSETWEPTPSPTYDTAASPCPREAAACVDVTAKKAWLQSNGVVTRGPVDIETGQPGHMTPLGTFHVSWKTEYTVSTIYGLPMPYAVFWAAGGIAFHQGPLDTPSHGCVHLTEADAKAFFDTLKKGDEVFVW